MLTNVVNYILNPK